MKITFKKVVSPCLFIGVIILKKGEKPIISFYKIPDIVRFFLHQELFNYNKEAQRSIVRTMNEG
ncbi:hypothetical protein T190607A02C_30287 [Tenacibaculum sp. 190524A02b]